MIRPRDCRERTLQNVRFRVADILALVEEPNHLDLLPALLEGQLPAQNPGVVYRLRSAAARIAPGWGALLAALSGLRSACAPSSSGTISHPLRPPSSRRSSTRIPLAGALPATYTMPLLIPAAARYAPTWAVAAARSR